MHPSGAWERWWVPQGAEAQSGFFRGVEHRFAFGEQTKCLLGAEHTPREMRVVRHQHRL